MTSPPYFPDSDADLVVEIVGAIRKLWPAAPQVAIILGTGLGGLASRMDSEQVIPYEELHGFPRTTALGHGGRLVCGQFAGRRTVAWDGRFHLYEGYSASQVTLPVRLARQLGAEVLIVSNASGGLNPQFRSGDIMVISDHINCMGGRTARLGCGRTPPSRDGQRPIYDRELATCALSIGRQQGFPCHRGTYIGVLGPNYETRTEYRFLRRLGGDAVGMSSIPEVLSAAQCGMRVLALSTVTNVAHPDAPLRVDAQHVVDIAALAEPRLSAIVAEVARSL